MPFKSDANHSSISLRVSTFGFIVWASQKIKEKGAQPCSQGLFPISKGKALGAKLRGPLFYADTGWQAIPTSLRDASQSIPASRDNWSVSRHDTHAAGQDDHLSLSLPCKLAIAFLCGGSGWNKIRGKDGKIWKVIILQQIENRF